MNIFLIYLGINSPQNTGYSYGLGYISSVLKQNGHTVDYIAVKDKKDIASLYEAIKEKNPKLIGFSAATSQFNYLHDIAKTIKNISHAFIVCGGIHATLKPDCILEIPELDAIVRGEGEFPMLELADALENKIGFGKIRNLWFKEKDLIVKNEIRPLIKNLDELPFPDKGSLDYQRVIDENRGNSRFIFSRGCIFECTYCSNKALSNLYGEVYFRSLSPQKAIEEISLDADKYKFNYVFFDDDTISLNKDWFYKFFLSYKQRFKYPFACNIRSGTIDSDMVKLLKEAGNDKVIIGIEHGNEEFRKTVLKRNITNKQMIEDFKLFDQHGIRSKQAFVMTGLPFENRRLFMDTVRLCRRLSIVTTPIAIFQPYPGTELDKICRNNNWLPDKSFYRERSEAVISYPGFSKKEIQLCYDIFPFLLAHKFIPLNLPLGCYIFLSKVILMIVRLRSKIRLHARPLMTYLISGK